MPWSIRMPTTLRALGGLPISLLLTLFVSGCSSLFWMSPTSRLQTLDDCVRLKQSNSAFYPPLCDRILMNVGMEASSNASTATEAPLMIGWGWGPWGEWQSNGCPPDCGRRCRIRLRVCGGPHSLLCAREGRAYDLENCEGRENENDDDDDDDNFQRGSNNDDDQPRNREDDSEDDEVEDDRNEALVLNRDEDEENEDTTDAFVRKGIRRVRKLRRTNNKRRRDRDAFA